jgi:hypothetical protein
MARDKNTPARNNPPSDSQQSSRFDREAVPGQSSSERGSSGSERSTQRDRQSGGDSEQIRDNQQIADDEQQSDVVDADRVSSDVSDIERAEESRERVPPRRSNKEGGRA